MNLLYTKKIYTYIQNLVRTTHFRIRKTGSDSNIETNLSSERVGLKLYEIFSPSLADYFRHGDSKALSPALFFFNLNGGCFVESYKDSKDLKS